MAITPIYYPDGGGPTSFELSDYSDPMTYVAWCNYVVSENIKHMEEAGLQWSDGLPEDLESAWTQQDNMLRDLESQFYGIGDVIEEKMAALPSASSLSQLASSFIEGGLELFGSWLLSKLVGAVGGPITAILLPLTATAVSSLLSSYTSSKSKVSTFTGMIIDLLAMTPSTNTYLQRASQIASLTNAVTGILDETAQAEHSSLIQPMDLGPLVDALNKIYTIPYDESKHEGLQQITIESEEGSQARISLVELLAEWQKVQALSEKIVQCPTTGRHIYTKSIPERSEEA